METLLRAGAWVDSERFVRFKANRVDPALKSKLSIAQPVAVSKGGKGMFEMSYFSWVWEPTSGAEVSVATKSDDAGVDTRLGTNLIAIN